MLVPPTDTAVSRGPGASMARGGTLMKIVVIGGTGLIGSKLVTTLGEHGRQALAASPNTGVNTLTGEGLSDALAGASVVVDVANSPSFEDAAVMAFFETSTRNLMAAETTARVGHHVALSVVGTERLAASGYFRAKIVQESLIKKSSIPYSLVHATQFFEFVTRMADAATESGMVRVAPVLFQPIAGEDVAEVVGRTAVGSPLSETLEVAGPEQFRMDEFFHTALAARNDPREVVPDPHARYFGAELSEQTLVPAGPAILGEIRYADWPGRTGK
ncbi:SDR family oxidoreductase [Amycolatopsis sp. DSM 110486]|uniref:SDR family oxidoreductase n=1 Tax=Amycolatopsis sp. DSM 110486 TaxID=2865832 RepID=UPI0021023BD1|nr:SDR family oxidoreductase [Amycolatopsis sp. DSM 110486]